MDIVTTTGRDKCARPRWWDDREDLIAHIEDDMQQLTLFKPETKQNDEQALNTRGIEIGMRVEFYPRYRELEKRATGIYGVTLDMRVEPTESHGPDVQFLVRVDEACYDLILPDQPYRTPGTPLMCNRPESPYRWYSALYLRKVE